MGSFQNALVKALPGIIGTGIAVIGGKLIDAVFPPKSSAQLFQEYYKAVENSNLPKTEQEAESILSGRNRSPAPSPTVAAPTAAAPTAAAPTPPTVRDYNASGRNDMAVMTESIANAIDSLKLAKDHTRCSLCRATLAELEQEVREKTAFIQESTRLWNAMQDLKAQGVLQKDATWSEFTAEQKQQVKAYAGK